jgi:hypothetical protein
MKVMFVDRKRIGDKLMGVPKSDRNNELLTQATIWTWQAPGNSRIEQE